MPFFSTRRQTEISCSGPLADIARAIGDVVAIDAHAVHADLPLRRAGLDERTAEHVVHGQLMRAVLEQRQVARQRSVMRGNADIVAVEDRDDGRRQPVALLRSRQPQPVAAEMGEQQVASVELVRPQHVGCGRHLVLQPGRQAMHGAGETRRQPATSDACSPASSASALPSASMRLSLPIRSQTMLTSNPRRIIASIWLMTKVCDRSGNSPTTKPIFMLHVQCCAARGVPGLRGFAGHA